jgi:hypothetical protein
VYTVLIACTLMHCMMFILLHNRGLITIVRLLGGAGGRSNSSNSSGNAGTSGDNHNSSSGYMHSDDGGVQDIILDTFIEILAPVRTAYWHTRLLLTVCNVTSGLSATLILA